MGFVTVQTTKRVKPITPSKYELITACKGSNAYRLDLKSMLQIVREDRAQLIQSLGPDVQIMGWFGTNFP